MDRVEPPELVAQVLSVLVRRGAGFATAEDAVREHGALTQTHIRPPVA